jgi:hypothetical protein
MQESSQNRLLSIICAAAKVQPFHIHHLLVDPVNIHRACPFSLTAFMFASESSVSSFAMNFPRILAQIEVYLQGRPHGSFLHHIDIT